MDYDEFVTRVEEGAGLDTDAAEQAIASTLTTLAERISEEEAEDLASELPHELKAPLQGASGDAEIFSAPEFLRRVAEREGVGDSEARQHAGVVLAVVREAISGGEFEDILLQLPDDYLDLLA